MAGCGAFRHGLSAIRGQGRCDVKKVSYGIVADTYMYGFPFTGKPFFALKIRPGAVFWLSGVPFLSVLGCKIVKVSVQDSQSERAR